MKPVLLLPLMFALVACGERKADTAATPAAPPAPVESATPAAPADAALAETVPGAIPAAGAIGFAGFGPAPFGASAEQVRMAWGRDLGDAGPAEPGGCYLLVPQPRPATGFRIAFMLEGERFARIDVDAADILAPGGGRVGMDTDAIRSLYAGRVHEQSHKYVEGGKYLRIADQDGGKGVLLFETDADGKVIRWRIGVPPQVDYVEGCS